MLPQQLKVGMKVRCAPGTSRLDAGTFPAGSKGRVTKVPGIPGPGRGHVEVNNTVLLSLQNCEVWRNKRWVRMTETYLALEHTYSPQESQ